MNISVENIRLYTLNVGYAEHDGDWNWQHVRSPFARLYFVTEGEAQVLVHGDHPRQMRLTSGKMYLVPPYTEHSNICTGRFAHYYIHVYEDIRDGVGVLADFDYPFELEATEDDLKLFRRLAHLNPFMKLPASDPQSYDNHPTLMRNISWNHQRDLYNKVESRGILFILFSRFLRQACPKSEVRDKRISASLAFIREHITGTMEIGKLADIACMSKDHFIRCFRSEVGTTPNAYIIQRKIERAELLLITTDIPVGDIADKLDFSDHSYFNRVFKKMVGCSPRQYRRQGGS